MNTIITIILAILNGLNFEAKIEETAENLLVKFSYGGTPLELPVPWQLEYSCIDSFDLALPKIFVSLNGNEHSMLDMVKSYCNDLQYSPKPIRVIVAPFYIWSKWADKRGLIPDPILDDADEYGELLDKIVKLKAER